jgi:hypothetical protein
MSFVRVFLSSLFSEILISFMQSFFLETLYGILLYPCTSLGNKYSFLE